MIYLLLLFGVFCCAASVVFIREANVDPILLAGFRVALAGMILWPLFLKKLPLVQGEYAKADLFRKAFWPSVVLAAHFVTWNMGARLTPAANATLIVSLVPLVMPFLLRVFFKESISTREAFATVVATGGLLILSYSDLNLSAEYLWGDVVCLISMLLMAVYLAAARGMASLPSVWLYVVPMYLLAGVQCFVVAFAVNGLAGWPVSAYDWLNILAVAIVPTVFGHSILNYAMQQLPGQTVSVVNVGQFVFAGLLGYWVYAEKPVMAFYAAAALMVLSMLMVLLPKRIAKPN